MKSPESLPSKSADSLPTFPDGAPIGEWVVICTKCHQCGRNPEHLKCPICGGTRIPTVDFLRRPTPAAPDAVAHNRLVLGDPPPRTRDFLGELTAEESADIGEYLLPAIEIVRATQRASTSKLQRRLRLGYCRSSRILEVMERLGLVGPERSLEPREVLFR